MNVDVPHDDEPCRIIDARGLYCPEPVMLLHNAVRDMCEGDVVAVIATDPSTQRDIPKFCQFLGHVLLDARKENNAAVWHFRISKSERKNS